VNFAASFNWRGAPTPWRRKAVEVDQPRYGQRFDQVLVVERVDGNADDRRDRLGAAGLDARVGLEATRQFTVQNENNVSASGMTDSQMWTLSLSQGFRQSVHLHVIPAVGRPQAPGTPFEYKTLAKEALYTSKNQGGIYAKQAFPGRVADRCFDRDGSVNPVCR